MTKYIVTAVRTTHYLDTVEANSLEEAMSIVDEWVADDFTIVNQDFQIEVK